MASAFGNLNGSGPQQIWLNFYYISYNRAGNYSTWGWEVRYYGNGYGSWTNDTQYWSLSGFAVGNYTFTIPQSARYDTWTRLGSGTFRKYHDANGRLAAGTLTASINTNHSSIGDGSVGVSSGTPPRIPKVPGKTPNPTFQSATATSISFGISQPSDNGGSTIQTYNLQASRNAAFTDIAASWNSGSSNQVASPLDPGTPHWIRYRAVNGVGAGPWSNALQATTLPGVAPGMGVLPALDGKSATVNLTPPGGASGVDSYRIERRPVGGSVTIYNTPTSPMSIPGLTPGASYQWRSSAFIGGYQSPWTDWVTVTQPKPNTSPGDYFDGSSAARGDLTFAWTGTANNSISQARGVSVTGWSAPTSGGGSTELQRVTGGRSGQYAARLLIVTDRTGIGAYVGMNYASAAHRAAVAEGGVYYGSIYVRPSRAQRLVPEMVWVNAAGATISVTPGEEGVAQPGEWTRFVVSEQAPDGATGAAVRIRDALGEGFSPWLSGEWMDADDAMVGLGLYPYFDGSTPDTAEFAYEWVGTANASASLRTVGTQSTFDPLADPDCPPIPSAPQPPVIEDSCIEDVGSWRRYWAIIPQTEILEWLAVVPTLTLTTGMVAARQVRVRFYPNPASLAPGEANDLEWESEQTVSYIPPQAEFVLDGVSRQVWASVDGGEDLPADHLLYGTGNGPATWPILSCGVPYLISFDVPLDAPAGNLTVGVALTNRMM